VNRILSRIVLAIGVVASVLLAFAPASADAVILYRSAIATSRPDRRRRQQRLAMAR